MSVFTRQTEMMLKRTGDLWETQIDNECVSFYAVFDAENRLEDDNTGLPVLIQGSVITVLSSVAKKFTFGQELTDNNDDVWTVREVMKMDDGFLSRVTVVEKGE